MSISRRIALGLTAAALATCGLVGAGAGIGVTAAVAAPVAHHNCPSKKGKYPPGKCKVNFSKSRYHKGKKVHLKSGKVFKPGERVDLTLICPANHAHKRYVKHYKPRHAAKGGAVTAKFKLPKKMPSGSCQVVLFGKKSHVTLTGKISVRK
jgi:hypothetical protein